MKRDNDYVCCFGEILWDLLPAGKQPGGAPMNVAFHLKNLGMEVAMISKVGDDALGREILEYVRGKNCPTDGIQTDPHHQTGIVEVNITQRTEVKYTIVHPVAWDLIEETPEALALARDAYALVFGTLACRDACSRKTLLALLAQTKALKVFDVNLRPPHYTRELIETLLQHADMVKLNEDELGIVSAWIHPAAAPEEQMQALKDRFDLQAVILTRGGDGAMLLDETGLHRSKVYHVEVKDTIGSGDSFLAGMIRNRYLKKPAGYALDYACALGALVATHHGANPPITNEEIVAMMNR